MTTIYDKSAPVTAGALAGGFVGVFASVFVKAALGTFVILGGVPVLVVAGAAVGAAVYAALIS